MIDSEFLVYASQFLDKLTCNDEYEYVDEVNVEKVLLLIQYMLGAYLSTLDPYQDAENKVLPILQTVLDTVK